MNKIYKIFAVAGALLLVGAPAGSLAHAEPGQVKVDPIGGKLVVLEQFLELTVAHGFLKYFSYSLFRRWLDIEENFRIRISLAMPLVIING